MAETNDAVDVAMADTFPASDSPSWGGGTTGVRDAPPRPKRPAQPPRDD